MASSTEDRTAFWDVVIPVSVNGKVFSHKLGDMPLGNLVASITRTMNHQYGNENASTIGKHIATEILKVAKTETKDAVKAKVKAWRDNPVNKATNEKLELDAAEKMFARLMSGIVNVTQRGERRDPVDAEYIRLVDVEAKKRLKSMGGKYVYPTNDETILKFGGGMTRTRKQMRDKVIADMGPALKKLAQDHVAASEKASKAPKVAITNNDPAAAGL